MSGPVDPATGKALPIDTIQRVLYVFHPVHVYAIPPLTSMKGYTAADWTVPDPNNKGQTRQIFTARLRILETAVPAPPYPPPHPPPGRGAPAVLQHAPPTDQAQREKVKADILLEDPDSGNLFAAAPYTDLSVVEHTLDSSRFFAVRVVGGGRKVVLGIGFEDRSEAFDFGVALQEARKVLGFPPGGAGAGQTPSASSAFMARGGAAGGDGGRSRHMMMAGQRKQQFPLRSTKEASSTTPSDYSLKPGETIRVQFGGSRPEPTPSRVSPDTAAEDRKALFSIPPPPPGPGASLTDDGLGYPSGVFPRIPPTPGTKDARTDRRRRPPPPPPATTAEEKKEGESQQHVDVSGDGDDEFGEFQ